MVIRGLGACTVACLVAAAMFACGGGTTPTADAVDLGQYETQDAIEGAEVDGEDAEVPDAPDGEVSQPPFIDYHFVVAGGVKGGGQKDVSLVKADEPPDYAGTPGFQVDVVADTKGIENGRDVALTVAGNVVATKKVAVDATGKGVATFPAVTLTHSPAGYEVKVSATNAAGLEATASKTVHVDVGTCGVDISPKNTSCFITDANPLVPGVQVAFTVTNPDRTCDTARVLYTVDGVEKATQPMTLGPNGSASIEVTLLDSADADGVAVTVVAEVADSESNDRTATTSPLVYVVDLVDPVITIAKPDKATLTLADDKDNDPSNGLTIDVSGTEQGVAAEEKLKLTVNDQPWGEVVPGTGGAFAFVDVAIETDGKHTFRVSGMDACGRTGSSQVEVVAQVTKAAYAFITPAPGSTLWAKDDAEIEATDPLSYETTFTVLAESVAVGTKLTLQCRKDAFGSPAVAVGTTQVAAVASDDMYAIPAVLDVQVLTSKVLCQVVDDAVNPSSSAEAAFTVALPAPGLAILAPKAGASVNAATLPVAVFASGLDGATPTVRVLDVNQSVVVDFAPPGPISAGGASWQVPLSSGGVPIPDAGYTLVVDALDAFGNRASEIPGNVTSAAFVLDTAAPVVSITAPDHDTLDPGTTPGDADQDPAAPGYQTTVAVDVTSGGGDGTSVCLKVNGASETCQTLTGGASQAQFAGVTLQPGANAIEAWGTDAAKNVGAVATRTLTLNIAGLRVAITAPAKDGPIAILPFDLSAQVADAAEVPVGGASVTLFTNGAAGETKTTDGFGKATFQVATLATSGDTFVVHASLGGLEGDSAPRRLYLKTTQPSLAFDVPKDGDSINKAYAACAPGFQDCVLDVSLAAANLEDGSAGALTVSCGGGPANSSGFVLGSVLAFTGVTLPDQSVCTLTATATDLGGQATQAGPIQVAVDRVAPAVKGYTAPAPASNSLGYADDEAPGQAGLQYTVRVLVAGLEAGAKAALSYGLFGGTAQTVEVLISTKVPDSGVAEVVFPQVTLPDGTVDLRVTLTDLAGNVTTASRLIAVWVEKPVVRIGNPLFVPDATCATAAECAAGGACAAGRCAFPWGVVTNRSLRVALDKIPAGADNLRICADTSGLTGAPCSTTGFKTVVVTTAIVDGGFKEIPVTTLPDGHHHLIAEARVSADLPWASSLDTPSASERERYVYQDLVPPVVTNVLSPSDANGDGLLSGVEAVTPGTRTYTVRVQGSEQGAAELRVNGIAGGSTAAFSPPWDVTATLAEGGNEIYAVLTDVVGNQSPLPPSASVVYYRPTVDTVPPTLTFTKPAGPVVKAGDTKDVVVTSDAIGRTVSMSEKLGGTYVEKATAPVAGDGMATFAAFLSEGNHDLRAAVTDLAGNPASVDATVFVDTVVPQMAMILPSPTSITVLADADDAQPVQPGFQVEVSFGAVSADSASWEVSIAYDCDATYTVCAPPTVVATGPVTSPGALEPSIFPTVYGATTPYHLFIVKVFDNVGNVSSKNARVEINLAACQVTVAGVTLGGYVNNLKCPVAGSDCATAVVPVTVTVATSCGAVDMVRLIVGAASQDAAPVGQQALFNATFTDGTVPVVEARAYIGASQTGTSGASPVTVDLRDPVVAFTTPAAGSSNVWGRAADGNGALAGLQTTLHATWSDANLSGGSVSALTYDSGTGPAALPPTNVTLPLVLAGTSGASDFAVTIADQTSGTVAVTVQDVAGNEAVSTFTTRVDLIPPSAVALATPVAADVNVRRPAVTLRWTAVGDNGTDAGTKATSYDVRYSTLPITTETEFLNSCHVTGLAYTAAIPLPAVAGTAESFTVTGPDIRDPAVAENGQPCKLVTDSSGYAGYNFAVRAIDAAGNAGAISTASVVALDFGMRFARIFPGATAPFNSAVFQRRIFRVGDLNGDGKGDLALGGASANAYCIVYGHRASVSDPTVADLTLAAGAGANHLCLAGATGRRLGSSPVYLGDVNHDGVDDLGVGDGASGSQTFYVHFGVAGGTLSATPNLTITGALPVILAVPAAGGGDFNNDLAKDILIGSKGENKAYIIPGNASWTAATNLAINLASATDRATYKVVTLTMVKDASTPTLTEFGAAVAFVKDTNGDGFDEAAVSVNGATNGASTDPTQVVVFKGRAVATDMVLSVSQRNGFPDVQPDDANSARLIPDNLNVPQFGVNVLSGLDDLDGDGKGDVVISHSPNLFADTSTAKSVYGFYGSAIGAQLGKPGSVQILAPTAVPTGGIYRDPTTPTKPVSKGFVVYGPYDYPATIGNLDDDPVTPPASSEDLSYALFSTTSAYGSLRVRLNVADPAPGGYVHGSFPWAAPTLIDPLDPTGLKFGYIGAAKLGDFNGDGFADVLIGTNNAGYALIFY